MPKAETSIKINAPIERCYKLCKSFDFLVRFVRNSQPGASLTIEPIGENLEFNRGTTYTISTKQGSLKTQMVVRVEEETPPTSLVLSGEQSLQASYILHYSLSRQHDQTLLKMKIEFEPKKGLLGSILSPVARILQQTALTMWAQQLKTEAESPTKNDTWQASPDKGYTQNDPKTNAQQTVGPQIPQSSQATEGVSFGLVIGLLAAGIAAYMLL